jgi:hypothetical protein
MHPNSPKVFSFYFIEFSMIEMVQYSINPLLEMLSFRGNFFPFFEKGIFYHNLLGYYNKKLVKIQN